MNGISACDVCGRKLSDEDLDKILTWIHDGLNLGDLTTGIVHVPYGGTSDLFPCEGSPNEHNVNLLVDTCQLVVTDERVTCAVCLSHASTRTP